MNTILDNLERDFLKKAEVTLSEINKSIGDNLSKFAKSQEQMDYLLNLRNEVINAYSKVSTVLSLSDEAEKEMVENLCEQARG